MQLSEVHAYVIYLPVMEETSFSWVASEVCGELCSTQEPEPDEWYKTITAIYIHIILICLSVGCVSN